MLNDHSRHLDRTTFHLHGQYNASDTDAHKGTITITRGYSKDHRPDLKQAVLNLMVDNKAGIPFLMSPTEVIAVIRPAFVSYISCALLRLY